MSAQIKSFSVSFRLKRLCAFWLLFGLNGLCAQNVIVNDHFKFRPLNPEVLHGDFDIQQVTGPESRNFTPLFETNTSFGLKPGTSWFRFKVNNPLKKRKTVVLNIGRKDLNGIEIWHQRPDSQLVSLGFLSGVQHNNYSFRLSNGFDYVLTMLPGENTIWIRNDHSYLSSYLCFDLYEMNLFAKKGRKDVLFLGLFMGILFVFTFLNIVLFLVYKKRGYLYYFAYLCNLFLLVSYDFSIDFGLISLFSRTMLSWSIGIAFSVFLSDFIALKRFHKASWIAVRVFIIGWLACIALAIVLKFAGLDPWIAYVGIPANLIFVGLGFVMAYLIVVNLWQNLDTSIIIIAYIPIGLSFTLIALRNLGTLPNLAILQYGVLLGFVFEAFVLTVAFARAFRGLETNQRLLELRIQLDAQKKELSVSEAEQKTKDQIAKELHNDIAASLSGLRILSKVAYEQIAHQPGEVKNLIEKINKTAQSSADSLSDLIWAVKPHENYLNDMADRFREYASKMLSSKEIDYSLQIPRNLPIVHLSLEKRRNMYLIFKEAINNAAKHSECSSLKASLDTSGAYLTMFIEDNGKGFDAEEKEGMGLNNMKKRANDIGARLVIDSETGEGTKVLFYLKL